MHVICKIHSNARTKKPQTYGIADTGETANVAAPGTFEDEIIDLDPINVIIPVNTQLPSSHKASLNINNISEKANKVNIIEGLTAEPLVSIPQLCDDGCMAIFVKNNLVVAKMVTSS